MAKAAGNTAKKAAKPAARKTPARNASAEFPFAAALTPLEAAALKVAAKKLEASKQAPVAAGQPVDVTVRIQGAVTIEPGKSQAITRPPATPDLLAVVLSLLPAKDRSGFASRLERAYQHREQAVVPAEAVLAGQRLAAAVSSKQSSWRAGAVSGSVSVTKLA